MISDRLIALGFKPLTKPYHPTEEWDMFRECQKQLEKGGVPYLVYEEELDGVEGLTIYTVPKHQVEGCE